MHRPPLRLVSSVLLAVLVGCSSLTDSGSRPCEHGPYFTELPVHRSAIASFVILGVFNPPGDIIPRPQTGLHRCW